MFARDTGLGSATKTVGCSTEGGPRTFPLRAAVEVGGWAASQHNGPAKVQTGGSVPVRCFERRNYVWEVWFSEGGTAPATRRRTGFSAAHDHHTRRGGLKTRSNEDETSDAVLRDHDRGSQARAYARPRAASSRTSTGESRTMALADRGRRRFIRLLAETHGHGD